MHHSSGWPSWFCFCFFFLSFSLLPTSPKCNARMYKHNREWSYKVYLLSHDKVMVFDIQYGGVLRKWPHQCYSTGKRDLIRHSIGLLCSSNDLMHARPYVQHLACLLEYLQLVEEHQLCPWQWIHHVAWTIAIVVFLGSTEHFNPRVDKLSQISPLQRSMFKFCYLYIQIQYMTSWEIFAVRKGESNNHNKSKQSQKMGSC